MSYNYKLLAEQYLKEAEVLKIYIDNLKKEAPKEKDMDNYYRLETLYDMYLNLKSTAKFLAQKDKHIRKENNMQMCTDDCGKLEARA